MLSIVVKQLQGGVDITLQTQRTSFAPEGFIVVSCKAQQNIGPPDRLIVFELA